MRQTIDTRQSFLRRIAKDKAANTIAISAASLVPLMAMVGGGVDASRYYMAETRLQSACDAGALAARRAMADDTFGTEERQIGENFFDQNYTTDQFGTEDLSRTYTATVDGEVNGVATGTLPTTIMGAFGYEDFDLSVNCEADINISNTDVMFVVDVTGSMGCTPDGTSCPGGNSADSRLAGLREAVMTFYDTVEESTSASAQVRYGMVPYASNVNVGGALMAENPSWLARSHTYQSREGDWDITFTYEPESYLYERTGNAYNFDDQGRPEENFYGITTIDDCRNLINSRTDIFVSASSQGSWTQVSQSGTDPRVTIYQGVVTYESFQFDGGFYYGSSSRCRLFYDHNEYDAVSKITFTEGRVENREFTYVYKPVTYDLTSLYDDNRIDLPIGWEFANQTVTWDGCVEEANTVAETNFNPVPAGANDLNIRLVPSNVNQYWKPVLFGAVWKRETGGTNGNANNTLAELRQTENERRPAYSCPEPAIRLAETTRGEMQTAVDALEADGNTYHDIGMIWGARFISPNGIFADDNRTAPNGDAVGRHIIFMTDGELVPNTEFYNMYGTEWWDRRVSGNANGTRLFDAHSERFQAACRLARQENVSVWVVAFGVALTQNLIDCADPGRSFVADDSAELADRFQEIAQRIAALRLTQ